MKPIALDPQRRQELPRRRHGAHDKRLYERLCAVLWVAEGKTRFEVADLLGRSVRQLAEWLRLFRNRGLGALCALHHRGDPGNLSAGQVERLKQEISTGRLTRDNVNGEQFVNLLRLLRATYPETERFVLYLDRARYYRSPVVKDSLHRHPEFELKPLPTYSPNLNLIERLWKFLRQRALSRWHRTFEAMQAAVSEVLDHHSEYRKELDTLTAENFHIAAMSAIPVEYQEVA
jgi:transposase